jgi:xanthine dehydrogenase YagR molybdenum-binding subunit
MTEAAPSPKENMGQPAPRIDGRLKVTGQARYGSDFQVPRPAYAFLVTSTIARGTITGFDESEARKVPGVLLIMTHENTKVPGEFKFFGAGGEASTAKKPLDGNWVNYGGDYVALVVAESFENAREAAQRLIVRYDGQRPTATMDQPGTEIHEAEKVSPKHKDPHAGNADEALARSEIILDAEYYTPTQHHNPIELFTTTCAWNGDELTVYEPSQFVIGMKNGLAHQLAIDPSKVKAVSPFVGGAFGSKGSITPRTVLVAMAARQLNRPVRLVATRDQGFTIATYRAETKHHVKLGADKSGKLKAYWHEAWEMSSRTDDYVVGGVDATSAMYQTPNIWTKVWIVKGDRNTPGFMRSPPEVPYMYALESAMDEMAGKLHVDPVEFRRINDTMVNPATGAPYTSRSLMKCYDEASRAFGWEKRNPSPGSMRDGDWLVGWGCATATYPTQLNPCAVRVRLERQGNIRVQVAAHDVGTGAYTVIGQMAAGMLNQPLEKVTVELGISDLPPGPVAGGSITTASTCSAVKGACDAIQRKLFQRNADDGMSGVTAEQLSAAFDRLGSNAIEELYEWVPDSSKPGAAEGIYQGKVEITGGPLKDKTMFAFGAEFVEVRINARTHEIRVPRLVGAFAAGRIMNPRTARSQLMGGMIWGVSAALFEETEIDKRYARYVNDNLADYLVPVNADIQDLQVILVPEIDEKVNPAGVKGLGELGNVGTNAAVANAVYHATGKRIRTLPIRIEDFFGV